MNSHCSSIVCDMIQEYNGVNPIRIGRDILHDHDGEVRVHPCYWKGCTMHIGVEHKQITRHLQQYHGINTSATSEDTQQITCLWKGCPNSRMKPGNLPRHILSHLGVRWRCSTCQAPLSREDAFRRHTLEKSGCQQARADIEYEHGSLVIDTVYIDGGWSASQNVVCIP